HFASDPRGSGTRPLSRRADSVVTAALQGMRRGSTFGFLMVLSAVSAPGPRGLSPLAVDMLAAHNAFRTHLRLRPLVWSDKLATVAQSWADTLVKQRKFYH